MVGVDGSFFLLALRNHRFSIHSCHRGLTCWLIVRLGWQECCNRDVSPATITFTETYSLQIFSSPSFSSTFSKTSSTFVSKNYLFESFSMRFFSDWKYAFAKINFAFAKYFFAFAKCFFALGDFVAGVAGRLQHSCHPFLVVHQTDNPLMARVQGLWPISWGRGWK